MHQFLKTNIPGLLLALVLAIFAYSLGKALPVVGGSVFGIGLGILLVSVWTLPSAAAHGVKFTSKYILQLAIILLGFEMNMASVIQVGRQSMLVLLVTMSAAFVTSYALGKILSLNQKLATLIGVGTAICGGSAIAAAAPAIGADDQDISYAISTIFLFNVIAVFLFPAVGHLLKLSDNGFGMWAGTAINDTSSVVAAGFSFSDTAGKFATIVKLTRSLMIIPVTLTLAILFSRESGNGTRFKFSKVFPWFILGFLIASILRSASIIPMPAVNILVWTGKFLIITAMAAIGLNTDIHKFIKAGPRALFLGAITWFVVASSSLMIQFFIHIL